MFALLLLPGLVAGFIACHVHKPTYYKIHRYEGQYLYLRTAEYGVCCHVAALAILYVIENFIDPQTGFFAKMATFIYSPSIEASKSSGIEETELLAKLCATVVIATILPFITNWLYRIIAAIYLSKSLLSITANAPAAQPETKKNIRLVLRIYHIWKYERASYQQSALHSSIKDSPLDKLFWDAIQQKKLILLNLENRKVYVGSLLSIVEPNEDKAPNQEIKMILFYSGYRDTEKLELTITNNYTPHLEKNHVSITVRQDEITSASLFDISVYNATKPNNKLENNAFC